MTLLEAIEEARQAVIETGRPCYVRALRIGDGEGADYGTGPFIPADDTYIEVQLLEGEMVADLCCDNCGNKNYYGAQLMGKPSGSINGT